MKIERVFHPYFQWEDFKFGMYESVCFMDSHQMKEDCKELLKCPEWLLESMTFVSHNWARASEQHLTNFSRNRRAWLGQAACSFTHGAPEYLTKLAWHELSPIQQTKANWVATDVIKDWESKYLNRYFEWQK